MTRQGERFSIEALDDFLKAFIAADYVGARIT
jgi:hypothetical protein